jgi:putative Mg2+ transporter-C (MgtC) family protein
MNILTGDLIKMLLAIAIGGVIGLEREMRQKGAGFRTITLICVGATLFTIMDSQAGASGRITANIVTGIGFLGGGVILHENNHVKGLTTAAVVWLSAALGVIIGYGVYPFSLTAAALVMVVMVVFDRVESWVLDHWEVRHYEIILPVDLEKHARVKKILIECGLRSIRDQHMKRDGQLICMWDVSGSFPKHSSFVEKLLTDPDILGVQW